jgi:hypothetical protein
MLVAYSNAFDEPLVEYNVPNLTRCLNIYSRQYSQNALLSYYLAQSFVHSVTLKLEYS